MPYFAVIARDAEGMAALRSRLRESHRHYLRHHGRSGLTVRLGGPTLCRDGSAMNGTLLVVEAPSEAQVHEFLEGDPYVRHRLFASTMVLRWQWSLGNGRDAPIDLPTAPSEA